MSAWKPQASSASLTGGRSGVTDEAQDSGGRGCNQFRSAPARARSGTAERRYRHVNQPRVRCFEVSPRQAHLLDPCQPDLFDQQVRGRDALHVGRGVATIQLGAEVVQESREWAIGSASPCQHAQAIQHLHGLTSSPATKSFNCFRAALVHLPGLARKQQRRNALLAQVAHLSRDLPWERLVLLDQPEHHGICLNALGA